MKTDELLEAGEVYSTKTVGGSNEDPFRHATDAFVAGAQWQASRSTTDAFVAGTKEGYERGRKEERERILNLLEEQSKGACWTDLRYSEGKFHFVWDWLKTTLSQLDMVPVPSKIGETLYEQVCREEGEK